MPGAASDPGLILGPGAAPPLALTPSAICAVGSRRVPGRHLLAGRAPALLTEPLDGFSYPVLMTRSSCLALIRSHKASPAERSGSVLTISFRFKETGIFPFRNLTEPFML